MKFRMKKEKCIKSTPEKVGTEKEKVMWVKINELRSLETIVLISITIKSWMPWKIGYKWFPWEIASLSPQKAKKLPCRQRIATSLQGIINLNKSLWKALKHRQRNLSKVVSQWFIETWNMKIYSFSTLKENQSACKDTCKKTNGLLILMRTFEREGKHLILLYLQKKATHTQMEAKI